LRGAGCGVRVVRLSISDLFKTTTIPNPEFSDAIQSIRNPKSKIPNRKDPISQIEKIRNSQLAQQILAFKNEDGYHNSNPHMPECAYPVSPSY
jgi:hypothetical protein